MNSSLRPTVTGSRAADVLLLAGLVVAVTVAGLRLRVYYRVTVTEIAVARVTAEGERALDTPASLRKTLYAFGPHQVMLASTRARIAAFMADAPPPYRAGDAAVVRWTVRYGYNRLDLDRQFVMEFDDAGRAR